MFVRSKRRFKGGKEHRYWSVVENVRNRDGRVVQRQVLYLGEINDRQRAAWCRSIEVLQGDSGSRSMALFAEDGEAPKLACEVVKIQVNALSLHRPRQWGACWLALTLWDRLELDRFWRTRLPPSRQGTRWLDVLKTLVCYQLIDTGVVANGDCIGIGTGTARCETCWAVRWRSSPAIRCTAVWTSWRRTNGRFSRFCGRVGRGCSMPASTFCCMT